MGFLLSTIFAVLIPTLVDGNARLPLPPQLYWNSVLPNTLMPKALSELVQPDLVEPTKNFVNSVGAEKNFFNYQYAASETQLHEDPNVALFFLEKDMRPGTTMNLHFAKSSNTATFLPRKTAQSIPFSSNKLPEIYKEFSVKPESVEANVIKETLQVCESSSIKGEEKYCATSLESMIDFSASKLGRNIQAISTEVEQGATLQKYTITPGAKKLAGDKLVVCHKQNYAYAMFYCHATETTRRFVVPLRGADGKTAKVMAVCHTDLAFQLLNVEPKIISTNQNALYGFYPEKDEHTLDGDYELLCRHHGQREITIPTADDRSFKVHVDCYPVGRLHEVHLFSRGPFGRPPHLGRRSRRPDNHSSELNLI